MNAVQPAAPRDQIVAGAQVEVIGVAEDDLGADLFEIAMGDALDRALRADRHERRRLDDAVRRREHAAARAPSVCVTRKSNLASDIGGVTVYNRE